MPTDAGSWSLFDERTNESSRNDYKTIFARKRRMTRRQSGREMPVGRRKDRLSPTRAKHKVDGTHSIYAHTEPAHGTPCCPRGMTWADLLITKAAGCDSRPLAASVALSTSSGGCCREAGATTPCHRLMQSQFVAHIALTAGPKQVAVRERQRSGSS